MWHFVCAEVAGCILRGLCTRFGFQRHAGGPLKESFAVRGCQIPCVSGEAEEPCVVCGGSEVGVVDSNSQFIECCA